MSGGFWMICLALQGGEENPYLELQYWNTSKYYDKLENDAEVLLLAFFPIVPRQKKNDPEWTKIPLSLI